MLEYQPELEKRDISESKKDPKHHGKHVLLEYNCPIIHIVEKHWEACSTETELFEKLLEADVETTHRAAKGDQICAIPPSTNSSIPVM